MKGKEEIESKKFCSDPIRIFKVHFQPIGIVSIDIYDRISIGTKAVSNCRLAEITSEANLGISELKFNGASGGLIVI